MYLDILENQCKRKLQGRQKLSESRCGSFPCLDTPIISIFLIDSVQSLTYSFNFFSISISIFSLKFCSIVPYKDLYSAYNSCLNAQVTRFTFSAAISKSLELKRSSICFQKAQSNSEKTQQSKLEKLHPQCVKTGSNERGALSVEPVLTHWISFSNFDCCVFSELVWAF